MKSGYVFRTAIQSLAINKLRTALTMLGIIFGVASVITMLALGNGARAAVEASFRQLGADQLSISSRQKIEDGELVDFGKPLSVQEGLALPVFVDLISKVEMALYTTGHIRFGRLASDKVISGVSAGQLDLLITQREVQPAGWTAETYLTPDAFIAKGRFFTHAEVLANSSVCVVGSNIVNELFGGSDPLGSLIWVGRWRCQVIGVIKELESTDMDQRYSGNPNDLFYVPVSAAAECLFEKEPSVSMNAYVKDVSQMEEAKNMVNDFLRKRHDIQTGSDGSFEDDFRITTRRDVLGSQQEAARTFSVLLASMAVVSLIVGGVGIMNVMLVNITERTREIGIRLAVGARRVDIVTQFLVEAVLISGMGGLLGILIGLMGIPVAANLNNHVAMLDPKSIPLSFGIGLLTGVIFGLYPAVRAAQLDPILALRYE